jgi:hypothetical protein
MWSQRYAKDQNNIQSTHQFSSSGLNYFFPSSKRTESAGFGWILRRKEDNKPSGRNTGREKTWKIRID